MTLWKALTMQRARLTSGGRIDRSKVLGFTFDGREYQGFQGDTLASALLANGVRLTARSFKYHRPRGIIGAGVEEPATLVELLGEDASGNRPATTVLLKGGLRARSVNCWPSPRFDLGAVTQLISRVLPSGFYYKTFKWPNWDWYERWIRKAAGLAGAPSCPPAQGRFENRYAHADVLIAGAGPAGLRAALTAARAGQRVFLADEGTEAGGSLLNRRLLIGGAPAMNWVADAVRELDRLPNVTHLQNATAWAYREHNYLMVNEKSPSLPGVLERNWRVRAKRVIVATGAIERTLVFANNDRPGVMLASAVQAFVNRYGVRLGNRAVIFTNNNSAYAVAADLVAAGVQVAAIVDSRQTVPEDAHEMAGQVEVLAGYNVLSAFRGFSGALSSVTVQDQNGARRRIKCDLLAVSGGWNPAVHLFSQSRGSLRYDKGLAAYLPGIPAQNVECVGAAAGEMTLKEEPPYAIEPLWQVAPLLRPDKAFLDIQNDVTVADVHLALREGYGNIEHVKRYTTGGMGIDQGKTGNINITGTVALQQGVPMAEVGTTTFRSPYTPVSFGAMAGIREDSVVLPYRHTPVTGWNVANGAEMYESGARWRRPGYFPRTGETLQDSINREARVVREAVGVYDGSPLGTFELKGRDVGRLLDHIYTNIMSTLKVGQCRYGLMLSDSGLIMDDGVAMRLGEHRWMISTSTGNADAVSGHIEELLQTEFGDWNVFVTTVTSQWNNATICGPRAREVMLALGTNIDLTPDALPFMHFAEGQVAGMAARVVRVSFTGELSFEVNVAPRDLPALWQAILQAGAPFGITPVGSEANHVLRVEKGFLSLGHEVDGTVDPYDLGLGWAMSKKKPDYLGKRSVALRRAGGAVRRELVGILPVDPGRMVPEGAPLTPGGARKATEGLVTACVYSVVLDRWVGLALLENGRARMGEQAHVRLVDDVIPVQITAPVFHDPDGQRMRS